ncbi:MAG TPA: hypothetical protein VGK48_08305 [Terriglobia bacterium]|jgi:hypothetical protein
MARFQTKPWMVWFLALVCVILWTQFAAVAELCPQAHGPNDYCAVCHLGVLPFLQTSISVAEAPIFPVERLIVPPERQADCTKHRTPGVSRAPPIES